MKKNEHYFPTVEYTKDPSEPNGWKVKTWAEEGGVEDVSGGMMDEAGAAGVGEDGGDALMQKGEHPTEAQHQMSAA